jgi:hypothetical protein
VVPAERDRGRAIVLYCARNGYHSISETLLASAFACDRSQVWKAVTQANGVDVQTLVSSSRLIWVGLEVDGSSAGRASASRIARSLQFASADALRKLVHRLTGHNWRHFVYTGALRVALDRWRCRASATCQ